MKNRVQIKQIIILIAIIIIEIACITYISSNKQEFHIDEIYSYVLSNSYNTDKLSNDDNLWGNWVSGEALSKYVSVQDGELFAFDKVYYNNSTDCHPPIYYWMLHSVCSVFPNVFNKWTGIGLNILFYIITLIIIFSISVVVIDDKRLVYLPVILYGLSPLAIETVTFIRMYMLLALLASLLILIHLKMFGSGINSSRMIASWLIIYLGSMTHYYFVVLSFWVALLFIINNLRLSAKTLLKYGAGCFLAETLFFASYPYVLVQATGSSTNNVGNEIIGNLLNWKLWIDESILLTKSQIDVLTYNKYVNIFLLMFVAGITLYLLVYWISHRGEKESPTVFGNKSNKRFIPWLASVYVCVFLSITFIGGEYVFLRYIYYIGPILYILTAYIINCYCRIRKKQTGFIMSCLIICSVLNIIYGAYTYKSPYLYREAYKDDLMLSKYKNSSLVVMTSRNPAVPTGNLTKMRLFNHFYMADGKDIMAKDIIESCLSTEGKCILYINTDTYYTNGYNAETVTTQIRNNYPNPIKAEYICDGSLGVFYRLSDLNF